MLSDKSTRVCRHDWFPSKKIAYQLKSIDMGLCLEIRPEIPEGVERINQARTAFSVKVETYAIEGNYVWVVEVDQNRRL